MSGGNLPLKVNGSMDATDSPGSVFFHLPLELQQNRGCFAKETHRSQLHCVLPDRVLCRWLPSITGPRKRGSCVVQRPPVCQSSSRLVNVTDARAATKVPRIEWYFWVPGAFLESVQPCPTSKLRERSVVAGPLLCSKQSGRASSIWRSRRPPADPTRSMSGAHVTHMPRTCRSWARNADLCGLQPPLSSSPPFWTRDPRKSCNATAKGAKGRHWLAC